MPRTRRLAAICRALSPTAAAGAESERRYPSCGEALGVEPTEDHGLLLSQLAEHGFCILPDVVPPSAIAAVRSASIATAIDHDYLRPLAHQDPTNLPPEAGMWAAQGPFSHGDLALAPYVADPRLLRLMEEASGSDRMGVVTTTVQVNRPRMAAHVWHPDYNDPREGQLPAAAYWPGTATLRPQFLNVLFFISPFTCENGGTWIVPRSHCRPAGEPDGGYAGLGFPEPELGDGLVTAHENTVHAVGPSGSVLVLDCRVWHCAPPNRSDAEVRTRIVLIPSAYLPTYRPTPSAARDDQRPILSGVAAESLRSRDQSRERSRDRAVLTA